jgi:hypothetical protein
MGSEVVAGLAAWRGQPARPSRTPEAQRRANMEQTLVALFLEYGAPLPLETVVDAIAHAWGIVESEEVPAEQIAHEGTTPIADLEAREELQQVWQEIRALPPNQRVALLLNLRDRSSVAMIESFVFLGIASIDELAALMEMTAEELSVLWNSLPLDDNAIASRLGLTRQQVINLRRAARERLGRRVKDWRK